MTLAGRVGIKLLYNPGDRKFKSVRVQISWRSNELEIRCDRENPHLTEGTLRPPIEQLQSERRCWNEDHVPERLGPQAPG